MPEANLSRRVEKVVSYPPLSELGERQRREFHEALLEAGTFEDLPGKLTSAIVDIAIAYLDPRIRRAALRT